ncbi:MAG: C40 family peptidase [Acidobacteria bacterium]|nr:C40 family peptidase [Acidobacteriota bacterium]MBI3470181.1 C40 family peptidase [Candidatus Solibacter usitatus]
MRRLLLLLGLASLAAGAEETGFWTTLHATIEHHLGRPYVWGAAGMKSFDCSGFVWRVWADNGYLWKRTTARKMYFSLPKASAGEAGKFGTVVFFDNMKHCGIVNDRGSFYHAQTSVGTNLSRMNDFWKGKVCGYRRVSGR